MAEYKFILPWPPSINGYWRTVNNRQIISKRGRTYRAEIYTEFLFIGLLNELIDKNVNVHMILNPPTLRKYDVDNFTKAVFDGLTAAKFWVDDEQVQKLTVEKGKKIKGGDVEISVSVV